MRWKMQHSVPLLCYVCYVFSLWHSLFDFFSLFPPSLLLLFSSFFLFGFSLFHSHFLLENGSKDINEKILYECSLPVSVHVYLFWLICMYRSCVCYTEWVVLDVCYVLYIQSVIWKNRKPRSHTKVDSTHIPVAQPTEANTNTIGGNQRKCFITLLEIEMNGIRVHNGYTFLLLPHRFNSHSIGNDVVLCLCRATFSFFFPHFFPSTQSTLCELL